MGRERPRGLSPRRVTTALLVLFLVGSCARGYGFYARNLREGGAEWINVLRGNSSAPEQYRIGVIYLADAMDRLVHLKLSQSFGILDLAGALLCALLLYRLLERKQVYRSAPLMLQWFGSAAYLALTLYYIDWVSWYQKVATLPTAGAVAVMVWLWTPGEEQASTAKQCGLGGAFFVLAAALAFVRADVTLMVCGGVFVASLLRWSPRLSMGRPLALATSALASVAVVATQLYLMKIRYPNASYEGVPVFMLKHDFKRIYEWVSWYIFLAPFLWTAARTFRRRFRVEGAGAAFLLGGLAYIFVWMALGRLDEVRIFIPMAMASAPLTIELAMLWVGSLHTSADLAGEKTGSLAETSASDFLRPT